MGSYTTKLQSAYLRLRSQKTFPHFPFLFICCLLLVVSSKIFAGTLQGHVLGKNNSPLANIRLDFSGEAQRTIVTDSKGQYRVTAPGGVYRVRFSNQQRRHEVQVTVPDSSVKLHNFQLSW